MPDDPLRHLLASVYGPEAAPEVVAGIRRVVDRYRPRLPRPRARGGLALDERDAILITYADQVQRRAAAGGLAEAPLRTLAAFCRQHAHGLVSGIHLLPFYPSSSDDGFAVIDYRAVDPALGTWADVAEVGRSFRLMFDAVINHASVSSQWFQGFLADQAAYRDYFITLEGEPDLAQVVRPRALPLLTRFETRTGPRAVWTTFSADQVDLNYRNPHVLLEIVDVLLGYVAHGAEWLRLDAIAYLWKETGTRCIHLPQTHRIIQLFRAVLDEVAPHVMLITETNVPHRDNIAYFGDGTNEAQLVYNFALPPLTLHAFQSGSAVALSAWAAGLARPSARTTFFNFLASHDGIGLNPARGILPEAEIDALVQRATAHGGRVSLKHNADGSRSPYELNINYFDALSDPAEGDMQAAVDRFVAAHAIMLALAGVPGIYFHSLFGSRGWAAGVEALGHNRAINREKLDADALAVELAQPGRRRGVYDRLGALLRARAATPAFHPLGGQAVLDAGPGLFAIRRTAPGGTQAATCLHNVTSRTQAAHLPAEAGVSTVTDLVTGEAFPAGPRGLQMELAPYQVRWLGHAVGPGA